MTGPVRGPAEGRRPRHPPPPGACDAHCHVFGPAARFPFAPGRRYTPQDAPKEELFALHARLGIERGVVVQATCHGTDNRALLDALAAGGGRYRGVAVVEPDVSDVELLRLHEAGVRGLRVNFVPRLVDPPDPETLEHLAERIAPLGWHLVVYFPIARLAELEPLLRRMPLPVVIDHMALPDPAAGPDGLGFSRLRRLAAACGHIWVKLGCPERISRTGLPSPTWRRSAARCWRMRRSACCGERTGRTRTSPSRRTKRSSWTSSTRGHPRPMPAGVCSSTIRVASTGPGKRRPESDHPPIHAAPDPGSGCGRGHRRGHRRRSLPPRRLPGITGIGPRASPGPRPPPRAMPSGRGSRSSFRLPTAPW